MNRTSDFRERRTSAGKDVRSAKLLTSDYGPEVWNDVEGTEVQTAAVLDYLYSIGQDFSQDDLHSIALNLIAKNKQEELDKLPSVVSEWKGGEAAREVRETILSEVIRTGGNSRLLKYLTRYDPEVLDDIDYVYSAIHSNDSATLEYVVSAQQGLTDEDHRTLIHQAIVHDKVASLNYLLAVWNISPEMLEEEYQRSKSSISSEVVDILLRAGLQWKTKEEYRKWLKTDTQVKAAIVARVRPTYEELSSSIDTAYVGLARELLFRDKKIAREILDFMSLELILLKREQKEVYRQALASVLNSQASYSDEAAPIRALLLFLIYPKMTMKESEHYLRVIDQYSEELISLSNFLIERVQR